MINFLAQNINTNKNKTASDNKDPVIDQLPLIDTIGLFVGQFKGSFDVGIKKAINEVIATKTAEIDKNNICFSVSSLLLTCNHKKNQITKPAKPPIPIDEVIDLA